MKQIKAARALLDWTQEDLSQRSGMSLGAINKLEREAVSPRQHTLDILRQTFEQFGIEFTDGPGVRLCDNIFDIRVLEGPEALEELFRDKVQTLRETEGELLLCGIHNSLWEAYGDQLIEHSNVLKELAVPWRALIRQGDKNFITDDPSMNYRWISRELFTQMPYYIYGNKYALVLWGSVLRVVIIKSGIVVEAMRRQFEINWENGEIPEI